nr:ribonuclease P protein component [Aliamphritea spongicola]
MRLAVNRNRVRRIIRESFRLEQQQLPNVDIVILARKGLGIWKISRFISLLSAAGLA